MALQKQPIPVNFQKGIDTKTANVLNTSFEQLENCYQQKTGSVKKRFGLMSLSTNIAQNSDVINEGKALYTYDNELLLHDGNTLYSYSEQSNNWNLSNTFLTNKVSATSIISNSYSQTIPDRNEANGFEVYAWEDARGGVRASIIDKQSGNAIVSDFVLGADYSRPKVTAISTFLFLTVVDTNLNELHSYRIDTYNPTSFGSPEVLSSTIDPSNGMYDIVNFSRSAVFAYTNSSNEITLAYLTLNNAIGSPTSGFPSPTIFSSDIATNSISIIPDSNFSHLYITYHNSTDGVQHFSVYPDFQVYTSTVVLDSYISTEVKQISSVIDGDTETFIYEITAASALNTSIKKQTLTLSTNTPGTASTLVRSVGMLSKIFTAQNTFYFAATYDTNRQATEFILRVSDAFIVSKFSYELGSGLLAKNSSLVNVTNTSEVCTLASGKRVRVIAGSTLQFITGIYKISFDFALGSDVEDKQLGENLHINGGVIQAYDSFSTTELGFLLYPEIPTITDDGAGTIANGTYLYKIMWEWIDQKGQVHRSAPSQTVSYTVSGGPKDNNVTIPTLRLTFKTAAFDRSEVLAVIYRTTASGTIFYRVTSLTSPLYNSTTADTIVYNDTSTDAQISVNEILYTTGGVMENISPPAASLAHTFQDRLFLGGTEDPNTIYFSKTHSVSEGVAFTAENQIKVNQIGGAITALNDLDDKFVVFKQQAIYVFAGNGSDDTGLNGTFSIPQIIAGEIGCNKPQSIAKIPQGLMFKSDKGIYLLNRALGLEYIGAPVESYNSLTISGAVIVGDLNQVRFTTEEGTSLVYDYFFNQWYTFNNQESTSAKVWKNQFIILNTDGVAKREVANSYSDDGRVIKTKIKTGWMSFVGLQGFQRFYSLMILGKYIGEHTLKISASYDFKDYNYETRSIIPGDVILSSIFGEGDIFGQNGIFGGLDYQDNVYQFEFKPKIQKCESVQITIQDDFPENNPNGAFEIAAMTFLIGAKQGLMKTAVQRRLS